jgi:hypothetical protein
VSLTRNEKRRRAKAMAEEERGRGRMAGVVPVTGVEMERVIADLPTQIVIDAA